MPSFFVVFFLYFLFSPFLERRKEKAGYSRKVTVNMEEENSTPQGEFNVIPPELQAIVVSFLDSTALAQLMEVNSYWCTLVREEFQRQPVQDIKFQGKDSLSVESPKIEPPWTIEFWIKKEMMCTTCSGILAFCPDRDVIKLEQYNSKSFYNTK